MPLQLLPLEETDLVAYAKIAQLGFAGEFSDRMYPDGFGQAQLDYYVKRSSFKFHRASHVRFNKIIDTSLPDDDELNKIISVAEWSFFATERSEEEVTEHRKAMDDLGPPPGANLAMSTAFHGGMAANRKRVWGGKPYVILQVLVTLPAHERRGAGARHLEWGVTAADELGLPAWLEASPAGRPLYERYGFRMVDKLNFDAREFGVMNGHVTVNMLRPAKDRYSVLPGTLKLQLPNVLVLGAGELGVAMLKALAAHAEVMKGTVRVAVLLRPGSKSAATVRKISPAFSILSEDLSTVSADNLADIFKLFDGIISCTGFAGGAGIQRKIAQAVALAAKTTRAERIRFIPWQFGVDYDVFGRGGRMELWDEQLDVRDMLRSSTWPVKATWTIVSTGIFTSFIFEDAFGVVNGLKGDGPVRVEAIGGRENKVTCTDVDDIAAVTIRVLFDAAPTNQVVYTAGQTISYGELADEVAAAIKPRQVELVDKTVPQLEEELNNDPDNAYKKYRVVFAEGRGVSWDPSVTWNVRNGLQLRTVKDWLARNVASASA